MNSFGIWEGGLLCWIKNELIWNLGGVFYIRSKMNSFGIWGGVFYIGSKMNSFGIWGVSFTLDQK